MLAPESVAVPAPDLVSPPEPLIAPETTVFDAPSTVRRNPSFVMLAAKVIPPAAESKVCAAPNVMALLNTCKLAELFTMPLEIVNGLPTTV